MPIAIALGLHPAVMVASQYLTPVEEIELAGALFGEPLQLARCKSVDLEVPAHAEIVLEGYLDPDEQRDEGPFGEFPGSYAPRRPNPIAPGRLRDDAVCDVASRTSVLAGCGRPCVDLVFRLRKSLAGCRLRPGTIERASNPWT